MQWFFLPSVYTDVGEFWLPCSDKMSSVVIDSLPKENVDPRPIFEQVLAGLFYAEEIHCFLKIKIKKIDLLKEEWAKATWRDSLSIKSQRVCL